MPRRPEGEIIVCAAPTHSSGSGTSCQLGSWGVEHLRTENVNAVSLAHVVDDFDECVHRLREHVGVPIVKIREDLVMPTRECCEKWLKCWK